MNNIPYELLWGVDVAIKKLRPGAQFMLSNSTFIEWNDPNGLEPPTWEEINNQIKEDRETANTLMKENNIIDNFSPNDGKNYIWNETLQEWEAEPDYDLE